MLCIQSVLVVHGLTLGNEQDQTKIGKLIINIEHLLNKVYGVSLQ